MFAWHGDGKKEKGGEEKEEGEMKRKNREKKKRRKGKQPTSGIHTEPRVCSYTGVPHAHS